VAGAIIPLLLGLGALACLGRAPSTGTGSDSLSITTLAFVSFLIAGGFLFLGSKWMAAVRFPVAFLVLMIPLPGVAVDYLETMSKLASAEAADLFFNIFGMPVLRDGVNFQLPGFAIRVAQECSGIHSSLVLLITSILASHLLLKTGWRRPLLVAFVIPLGILRNGFRIAVIGWLCVHVGHEMIDSPIHHQGGPLFFALSLIPLFLLLWMLRKSEATAARKLDPAPSANERNADPSAGISKSAAGLGS
jgi:exosortase